MLYDGGQGENMQLSTTNTCSFLGITPLTEKYRTAKYVDVKDGYTPGSKDVLADLRKTIFADPESVDFQDQLKKVADFWEANFQYGEPNAQPDKNNNNEWIKMGWRSNYP